MPTDARMPVIAGAADAPSCSLSPEDLGRRRVALADLVGRATERGGDDHGITLRFPLSEDVLDAAWSAVRAEAVCCPEFRYVLTVEPSRGVLELAVRTEDAGHARWLRNAFLENSGEGQARGGA